MLVDVNWRPVFWDDHEAAPQRIRDYIDKADILKLSDDEAEFIYGVGHRVSLEQPEKVSAASYLQPWLFDCLTLFPRCSKMV